MFQMSIERRLSINALILRTCYNNDGNDKHLHYTFFHDQISSRRLVHVHFVVINITCLFNIFVDLIIRL